MKKKKYFEPELDVCRLVLANNLMVTTTDPTEDPGGEQVITPGEEIPEDGEG